MKLTTRQLNKRLKEKLLTVEDNHYMTDVKVRVLRARAKNQRLHYPSTIGTLVSIQVCARVQSTEGRWLPLTAYGPRAIRNFLRKDNQRIKQEVSSWVRLWGFSSKVSLEKIDLRTQEEEV